ncbi:hypothetical protein PAPHI01_0461 [Pancytospora philotis]|nr:hypothetical protein PAPHI01_0461 [Pancytospora philotis]
MRGLQFVTVHIITAVFVSARLDIFQIANALGTQYGAGAYVDPAGPLNIVRGHYFINNDMIAKQRKYAAPMRLAYSSAGDANDGDCTCIRNAREDDVRKLPVDSEALGYLYDHYKTLKSMFTVENEMVVVDKSPQAPFYSLFKGEHGRCLELFAALLVLAGGADIRLSSDGNSCTDGGERAVSLVAHGAASSLPTRVLDLGFADDATLAVVEFFARYGGVKAKQVARYGLHYTDSPSFLIQAYICELLEKQEDVKRIFEVAYEVIAKLPADNSDVRQGPRFFTANGNAVSAYKARYGLLSRAERAYGRAQRTLRAFWQDFRHDNYSDGDDSRNIAPALLKLCFSLCWDPIANRLDTSLLDNAQNENELLRGLEEFVSSVFLVSGPNSSTVASQEQHWKNAGAQCAAFLEATKAKAPASETVTECLGGNVSDVLATEPKYFLVVLAWVLGEPEERLRSLRQLLDEALDSTGTASHSKQVGNRVTQMLGRFTAASVGAYFRVSTASDGARNGLLKLTFLSTRDNGETHFHALELVFRPEKVGVVYVYQDIGLSASLRSKLDTALWELNAPGDYTLSVTGRAELDKRSNYPVRALIQESIARCVNPIADQVLADRYIKAVHVAKYPLACHIALSHWMAHQPMQSQKEMVKAGDLLLPVFEKLVTYEEYMARRSDGRHPARPALGADTPVVAVLGNILGSAAAVDDELRPFVIGSLRHCAKEHTDLFPSILPSTDRNPRSMHEWSESAYDSFLTSVKRYDMPNMLLHHAESRARSKIKAASNVAGPWDSDVCAAVARCFGLRNETYSQSLSGDTTDAYVCYDRYSICALMAAAAKPAKYHGLLLSICGRWEGISSLFKAYAVLQMAFPKFPKLAPISPKLVAEVFAPELPSSEQVNSLLKTFAVFAHTEDDYCGVCSVFHHYRGLLRPEDASVFVELLKSRADAYKCTLAAISLRSNAPVGDLHTPPYSAIKDLLTDCLKSKFDAKIVSKRVHDMAQAGLIAPNSKRPSTAPSGDSPKKKRT